ncbi:MAG: YidH family protein [Prochlorococcaceae cyanobacterium]
MNLTNELAKQRNRAAAERTLMAWIRTCLSLISFGFGLDKIIGAINRTRLGSSSHADLSVRLLSMGFVLIGIVAMAAAIRQHKKDLHQIRRDDYVYVEEPSISTGTAIALIVIGALALLILILGAIPR